MFIPGNLLFRFLSFGLTRIHFESVGISLFLFFYAAGSYSAPTIEDKKSSFTSRSTATASTTIGITLVIPPRKTLSVLDQDLSGIDLNPQPAKGFNFEFSDSFGSATTGEKAIRSFCASVSPILPRTISAGSADKSISLLAADKTSESLINYCKRQPYQGTESKKERNEDLTVVIAPI